MSVNCLLDFDKLLLVLNLVF